jgi:hypothetical protein
MRLKEFLLEETNDFRSLIKPYNMVKQKPYYDQPQLVHYVSQSPKGKTILHFEINPKNYDEKTGKTTKTYDVDAKGFKSKTFTKVSDAAAYVKEIYDAFMAKHTDEPASDQDVVKWLTRHFAEKVTLQDIQGMPYVVWDGGRGVQLTRSHLPYLIFVDGEDAGDDQAGLGEINMKVKDFIEWLNKNGGRKVAKPKRVSSSSYYD